MENILEVSLVVESYNHSEGTSLKDLELALEAATQMINSQGKGEILLTDTEGDPKVIDLLTQKFPHVIRVEASGLSYDQAKFLAATQAKGKFVLYLDGDCLPNKNWLINHLSVLKEENVNATGGFTRYRGGFFAAVLTIMDFGFFFPIRRRILQCYASNNSGFRREFLLNLPCLEGEMRCLCYAYAQMMIKNGYPAILVPDAYNIHALPPFFPERFRQGYDTVASCWVNPALPEVKLLWLGILAAPLFYLRNVILDWLRVAQGSQNLDLNIVQMLLSLPLFPLFRLVDCIGISAALLGRRESYGKILET